MTEEKDHEIGRRQRFPERAAYLCTFRISLAGEGRVRERRESSSFRSRALHWGVSAHSVKKLLSLIEDAINEGGKEERGMNWEKKTRNKLPTPKKGENGESRGETTVHASKVEQHRR